MAKRGETRRRIVETTVSLLQTQGLNGTGLLQVLEEAGAPRGSLYFHFPGGKEELTAEAVDYAREAIVTWLRKSLDAHDSPLAAFQAITERYARRLERSDFAEGCPVAAVALEGTPGSERLRLAAETALAAWEDLLTDYLERHGLAAEAARDLATNFLCSLEGGLVLARARRSAAPLRAVSAQLRWLLPAS
ncbi:MAG: TetR/AcrR family transcriptional regulator [Chloroflexota bacterium]